MGSFTICTIVCFLFVFGRGYPLLQWSPNFSFTTSTRHFNWIVEASDTCVSLDSSSSSSSSSSSNQALNITSTGTNPPSLKGGYLFVVHRHEQIVVVVLSLLLDISVLKYHFTHEPHPKFRLTKVRKLCIYAHLIGGASEILFSLFAFLTGIPALSTLSAIPALLFQAPTAMYQAYSVFGSKRVLIPVAQLANAMHVFAAVRLLCHPTSTEALVSMILVLHLYVWARAFYAFLNRLRIMREASYTLSIALSGILVVPAALEFVQPLHIFTSVFVYNVTLLILTQKKCCGGDPYLGENNYHGVSIKLRATESVAVPPRMVDLGLEKMDDEELARMVFDEIDVDRSGTVDHQELSCLLRSWGLPESDVVKMWNVVDEDHDGVIDFNEFLRELKPVWTFGSKVIRSNMEHAGIFEARDVK